MVRHGIDVGAVDLVVQLGSPRSIATLLQRVGRSGHTLGGTPKGRLFALTRDQLVECAALVRGVRKGNLDQIALRDAPLDILAQQIVAACAAEDIREDDLREMVRGATPYAELADDKLEQILEMLAEGVSDRRGRERGAVDGCEDVVDRPSEIGLDHGPDRVERLRRHPVAQEAELGD